MVVTVDRRKKEEGRRKKEEGRRKKEEGRRKKADRQISTFAIGLKHFQSRPNPILNRHHRGFKRPPLGGLFLRGLNPLPKNFALNCQLSTVNCQLLSLPIFQLIEASLDRCYNRLRQLFERVTTLQTEGDAAGDL